MVARQAYWATLLLEDVDGNRVTLRTKTTYAWNSAIRATEEMLREYARSQEAVFTGDKPVAIGLGTLTPLYRRYWDGSNGELVVAQVRKATS